MRAGKGGLVIGWLMAGALAALWFRERRRRQTHEPRALGLLDRQLAEPAHDDRPHPPWVRDVPMPLPPERVLR